MLAKGVADLIEFSEKVTDKLTDGLYTGENIISCDTDDISACKKSISSGFEFA